MQKLLLRAPGCTTARVCKGRSPEASAVVPWGLCFAASPRAVVEQVCCRITVSPPGSPASLRSPHCLLQTAREGICLPLRQRAVPGEHRAFGVRLFCLGGRPALQSSALYVRFFLLCLSVPLLPPDASLVEVSRAVKTGLSFAAFQGNLPPSCPRGSQSRGRTGGQLASSAGDPRGLFPDYPNAGVKVCGPLPRQQCCTTAAVVGMGRWTPGSRA